MPEEQAPLPPAIESAIREKAGTAPPVAAKPKWAWEAENSHRPTLISYGSQTILGAGTVNLSLRPGSDDRPWMISAYPDSPTAATIPEAYTALIEKLRKMADAIEEQIG